MYVTQKIGTTVQTSVLYTPPPQILWFEMKTHLQNHLYNHINLNLYDQRIYAQVLCLFENGGSATWLLSLLAKIITSPLSVMETLAFFQTSHWPQFHCHDGWMDYMLLCWFSCIAFGLFGSCFYNFGNLCLFECHWPV